MSAVRTIPRSAQNPTRVAGILLLCSLLILLLALIILIVSSALPAFSAGLQGSLAEKAPYANTFRLLNLFWSAGWIVQLLGFGLLTRLLLHAGDESLPITAFIAILVAAIIGVLHGTFHMSVEAWAAVEAARTGSVPEIYEPLDAWIGASFRVGYITHLTATAVFGWAILRSRLLPSWVGRIVVAWSFIWLLGYVIGAGAPGILFIMPAVIGIELLRHG